MKHAALLSCLILAGCASPQYVHQQSNWDVCRLTMGGPHSRAAEAEAASRGLDCGPLYPAIAAEQQRQTGAALMLLQQNRVQPYQIPTYQAPAVHCQSTQLGGTVSTTCH